MTFRSRPGARADPRVPRIEWLVFATMLVAYAYFFQGGGWNQNSRFSQIRAIVEQGRLAVNDYIVYQLEQTASGEKRLRRMAVLPSMPLAKIEYIANTGDLSKHQPSGTFYPNKPPGVSFLGVPAYFLIFQTERLAGIDPDGWWVQTFNQYLVTVFSVGLLGALGVVLFFRVSRRLFGDLPLWTHTASAMTLGLSTMMLPFSTTLFDHVPAAVLLLAAFGCLVHVNTSDLGARSRVRWLLAGGAAAGLSVLINYLAVVPTLLIGAYAVWTRRPRRESLYYVLGGIPVAFCLLWYQQTCFGDPLTIANSLQHERFADAGRVLGVFGPPRWNVLWMLLFSVKRGLFITSPAMLLGAVGLVVSAGRKKRWKEVALMVALFLALLLINASFNAWHSGASTGPRYLIPAVPFLALGLAAAFRKLPWVAFPVTLLSASLMLAATAVNIQVDPTIESPLTEHIGPLLMGNSVTVHDMVLEGPVSVNPVGVYESGYYISFGQGSDQERWSSFNLGEFLWPNRLLSLFPLLIVLCSSAALLGRWAREPATS